MATPNEQLKNIYAELKENFGSNEYIKVIPFDDEPPEKYEVKFFIPGIVQKADGSIAESKEHSIFINIPFGFPHFPPSCTPQSATFHPDFDQAAICIGDFWNKDRSLSELILYIGRMILGEHYSTENAFNDSAVSWYVNNAGRLPFEKINLSGNIAEISSDELDEFFIESDNDSLTQGIDTIDEEDIAGEADYLGTGTHRQDEDDISFPTTAKASGKSSINRVYLLIKQKRFYELSVYLKELPDTETFEDRSEIEAKIVDLLDRAKKLQKDADEFEHQGNPKAAYELFQKVEDLVPDFPNIQENLTRTQKSVELSGEWANNEQEITEPEFESDTPQPKKKVTFFEETSKATIRFLPILAIILILVILVVSTIPFFKARSYYNEAADIYAQCKKLLDSNSFTQSKQLCEEAKDVLQEISLFKRRDRNNLQREIQQTLTSQKMVQGLSGRVFFQGKYVNKQDMDKILEFNRIKKTADEMFAEEQWKNAAIQYKASLKKSGRILDSIEPVVVREVKDNITIAEIHMGLERSDMLIERDELQKSAEILSETLKKAEKLSDKAGGDLVSAVNARINKIEYLRHLNLGKKFFSLNDWESAIKQYEKALRLQDETPGTLHETDIESLYANMAEAELYSYINSAKDKFSQGKLKEAIEQYQLAIGHIQKKDTLLNRINPDEIENQLRRIILRARIVQFKQSADTYLETKQFNDAIASLNEVLSAISDSGFKDEEEFRSMTTVTEKTIAGIEQDARIENRKQYLVSNYVELFQKHYPAASPDTLSGPKAKFVKTMNDLELYEIQCLERNFGRQIRLVMLYSFNPQTGKWAFYKQEQN